MIEVKKRQGETSSLLLYRFTKRIKQSGIMKEVKKRRFAGRVTSRRRRKLTAIHRARRTKEIQHLRKKGLL